MGNPLSSSCAVLRFSLSLLVSLSPAATPLRDRSAVDGCDDDTDTDDEHDPLDIGDDNDDDDHLKRDEQRYRDTMDSPPPPPFPSSASAPALSYPPRIPTTSPHHPHTHAQILPAPPDYIRPLHPPPPLPPAPTPSTAPHFQDGSVPVFRACAATKQNPTLTGVRIRTTRDALQVFYAVALSRLPMTVRRLDTEERKAIESGNVYVWEERGASAEATGLGIERWYVRLCYAVLAANCVCVDCCRTDGMRWSPSRVHDVRRFSCLLSGMALSYA